MTIFVRLDYISIFYREVISMPGKDRFPVFAKEGEVSAEFLDFFLESSRNRIECTCCGRVHLCLSSIIDDEAEIKHLDKMVRDDPDGWVDHADAGLIGWFEYEGKQVVFGCPCGYDVAIENAIWSRKLTICEYIVARTEREKKAADYAHILAQKAVIASDESR